MRNTKSKPDKNPKMGRPRKPKGPLRTFKFHPLIDEFIDGENERTGRDKVRIVEQALLYFRQLTPKARDEIRASLLKSLAA